MSLIKRSKLITMTIRNIGCIGNDSLEIRLDNIVCLVGKNNSGKSTVLRAYELAKTPTSFASDQDRHLQATEDQPSEIVIEAHIPEGIGNVDAKWKYQKDGFLIVKSRWQWNAPSYKAQRKTWNPTGGEDGNGDWEEDSKAGGADAVFSSRLPHPLRIGSLDDSTKAEDNLKILALEPLVEILKREQSNSDSELTKAIHGVTNQLNKLSDAHAEHFNEIAGRVTFGFQGVFPRLDVRLNVAAAPLTPKIEDLIKNGSSLRVADGKFNTSVKQQGTGARRALFWAMLQVHNELSRDKEVRSKYCKKLEDSLSKEEKNRVKKNLSEEVLTEIEKKISDITAQLEAHKEGAPIPEDADDPALPGYLLLIDEPENALHPMAARAAQRHLYALAESPDWQVIMTTHSPYFINPFENHTTIIRLERREAGLIDLCSIKAVLIDE